MLTPYERVSRPHLRHNKHPDCWATGSFRNTPKPSQRTRALLELPSAVAAPAVLAGHAALGALLPVVPLWGAHLERTGSPLPENRLPRNTETPSGSQDGFAPPMTGTHDTTHQRRPASTQPVRLDKPTAIRLAMDHRKRQPERKRRAQAGGPEAENVNFSPPTRAHTHGSGRHTTLDQPQ